MSILYTSSLPVTVDLLKIIAIILELSLNDLAPKTWLIYDTLKCDDTPRVSDDFVNSEWVKHSF